MMRFECIYCGVQCDTLPSSSARCEAGMHHVWCRMDLLAVPGTFLCWHCGQVVTSETRPERAGCVAASKHLWQRYRK